MVKTPCCTSTAGGVGLIPGWGPKIPHAMQRSQKKIFFPKVEADGNRFLWLWSNHERLICEVP